MNRAVGAAALLVAGLGVGGASPAAAATEPCRPTEGFTHCRIFDHSGAAVDFQVPAGVAELDFRGWGMGGDGNAFAGGGNAAYVAGSLDVTPGEHLTVNVGGWRVGGKLFGDALGGKAGEGSWGGRGGASTAVRAADGSALFIAAGGGGGGHGVRGVGRAGSGGTQDGYDATEKDLGGMGAKGGQGGAAGGEGGKPGADHTQGGAGGDGGATAGGGGAGYAGGGGGAGRTAAGDSGSGGGGSSYADPERTSDVRMLSSITSDPAAEDDPFWVHNPIDDQTPDLAGIGQGGWNEGGGDGRVVLQWKDPKGTPVVSELTRESGDDQTVLPVDVSDPMVVVARDRNGEPLPDQKVTFTLEDPDGLGVKWEDFPTEVYTDAQGRAQSPGVITGETEGDFAVRATSGDTSTTFTAHVKQGIYSIEITGGDEQRAKPGEAFADPLGVKVAKPGVPVADTPVEFRVEDDTEGAPVFEGDKRTAFVTTNARGEASAPELTAGTEEGTYTVVATVGEATARFTLEVTEEEATSSPSPSPSGTSDTATGGSDTDSGTGAQGDSGSLALTGAAGIGTLAGVAAALTALGWAATRLRTRSRTND
ncbi:hypothetical protein [Streptomyces sp. S.PB5]|uniref:hypothetical protein n=1 Tax=Streptomyces sp. S.PB5 TaxID=3020844 RepID=UPI0025B0ACA4|nr:hypothetical protein [Streptomyces sp. S.PB5]MDN3024626.1 hypothetical protein [Streptomyces sp. S.PB5]